MKARPGVAFTGGLIGALHCLQELLVMAVNKFYPEIGVQLRWVVFHKKGKLTGHCYFCQESLTMHVQMDATGLRPDVEAGFETLFKAQYKGLHAYAITIIRDEAAAEDIVQHTFFKLWEKKEMLHEIHSLAAYLYRSVYNESMNYLKHAKVRAAYQQFTVQQMNDKEHTAAQRIGLKELEQKLDMALKSLPEQCRTIFQMSRFEELKYREIADRLGLSVKTVENQMGKALRILRTRLVDYLPATLLFLLQILNGA